MNIPLFGALRRVNRVIKARRKAAAGRILSPCRRIEFVHSPGRRVCAMTFDDGPTALPPSPGATDRPGLTACLLDTLGNFGARATFDVIGSTAENYPDEAGDLHTHFVFGKSYDHYARFGEDSHAGAAACPEILHRLVREGHEPANHSYRHILFGPSRTVYRTRKNWTTQDQVVRDLTRLHDLVKRETGVDMLLARPPHYVDNIPDGTSAYSAYAQMGYQYMAASVDGGGWLPSGGDYQADVEAMVAPLRALLQDNPDALSGQIIFQKDGYNMSCQTPIASALPLQLALLKDYGYDVVTVSELMALSPFEDLPPQDPCFDAARALLRAGHIVGYRNNTCQPDRMVTMGELCQMAAPPGIQPSNGKIPYEAAMNWAVKNGMCRSGVSAHQAGPEDIIRVARRLGRTCDRATGNARRDAILALGADLCTQ